MRVKHVYSGCLGIRLEALDNNLFQEHSKKNTKLYLLEYKLKTDKFSSLTK